MTGATSADERLPLSALVSQLLVAFTIEFDNEFEHRMPHRTTNHGSSGGPVPGGGRVPWLVSMAMWVSCMRYVPEDGIPVRELTSRAGLTARSAQLMLKRMSAWWGYLTVRPDPADTRPKPPPADWLVRPTRAGRRAQLVWEPLTSEIEERWQARFGDAEVTQFRAALRDIVSQLGPGLPDCLSVWELRSGPRPATTGSGQNEMLTLPALMAKVVLAFGLGFQSESGLSLGPYTEGGGSRLKVTANVLRVLGHGPARVADIPDRTGVAKIEVDNWLGALDKHGYLTIGAGPSGTRFRVAELTPSGRQALDAYHRWAGAVESQWRERFGRGPVSALRISAERLLIGPAAQELWRGIEPYPDGWRAQVRRPSTLPHYPVLTHRGGFPDGS
jgi:DNA-binding MarR family transcriptional regulator